MKILIWTPSFYPNKGAMEDICMMLAEHLTNNGHKVVVLTETSNRFSFQTRYLKNIKIIKAYHGGLPYSKNNIVRIFRKVDFCPQFFQKRLEKIIKEVSPDLINIHYPRRQMLYMNQLPKKLNFAKLVLSFHGTDVTRVVAESQGERTFLPKPENTYASHFIDLCTKADFIVSCSQYLINEALKIVPDIEKKSLIVKNPVQLEYFWNAKPVKFEFPYLFCVGRMSGEKGFDLLIEAFKEVSRIQPNLKLLLGGDGQLMNFYKKKVDHFGLKDRILFLGYLDKVDVAAYMKGAKSVIVPSIYEGFGIVVLEAIASGRPVVATNVGGIPEAGCEFVNYASPNPESLKNKIIEALDQSPQDINSVQNHLQKFTAKQMLNEYEKVFFNL